MARLLFVFSIALFVLGGCSRPAALVPFDGPVNKTRSILVATSRSAETGLPPVFGGERAEDNIFAEYRISIPPDRTPGSIETPRGAPDPERDFLSVGHDRIADRSAFISQVNARLASLPPSKRRIMVYVHGYNTAFPSAVIRAAQIAEDYHVESPMVLYSWPSAAKRTHYVYDRDSALFARDRFVDTLSALSETRATSIQILAHSMGTFLTMESLRTLRQMGKTGVVSKINAVILAEPDIDVDVFRSQIETLDTNRVAVVVFGSHNDRALRLSQFVAGGHPRVGEAENIEELRRLGVIVIDVSNVSDGTWAQHSAFESAPELVELIGSGALTRDVFSAEPGADLAVTGLNAATNAALAIIHIPFALTQ